MLEIKGLVDARRGAGITCSTMRDAQTIDSSDVNHCNDAGPFELLQARQLLENNIAESLPRCRLPVKISSKCAGRYSWKSVS